MTFCHIGDYSVRPNRHTLHSSIVRQRQLCLYGHVAGYPEANTAHRVVSVEDSP